jgi:PAS domain S-box-containing protein
MLEAENAALRLRVEELSQQLEALLMGQGAAQEADALPYAAFFDAQPVPVVLYQTDGLAVAINRSNEELLATSREHIVGRHNIFADPEAIEQGYAASFRRALAGEVVRMPPTAYDTARAQLDGRAADRLFWLETTYFPIRDSGGAIVYVGEANQDVTDRERARAERQRLNRELRERERRFRMLFENAGFATALLDADGRMIESNPALHTMLGYTADELRGRPFADITHPEDVEPDLTLFASLVAGERASYQLEKRYLRKDGQVVVGRLSVSAVRNAQGQFDFAIGMAEDITARRSVEEALRASQALLRALVDELPSLIYVKNLEGRYLMVNRQFAAVAALPLETIEGQTDYDLFPTELAGRFAMGDQAALERGAMIAYEEEASDGDRTLAFETIKFPLFDPSGRCYAVCGISTNVTERKHEEARRLEFERKLLETQKLESLGLLAGGVAHDFNNLLVAILGNASFALEELPPAAPARENIQHIEIAARRAADLTRQMLAYAGKGRFVIQPLDLDALVQEISDLLNISIPRQVSLRYTPAANLPLIEGDATQLRQVVMNLVINAAEAIGNQPGSVTLATGTLLADRAYLAGVLGARDMPEGRYVYLDIADTGAGMDAATRAKIFEPFFTTKFTGRGLGLAVVLGIVRGHHGAITVSSEPGRGTRFRLLLPALGGAPALAKAAPETAELGAGGGTVLVIDDEEDVRRVAKRLLERLGFAVLAAPDGAAGLELFRANAGTVAVVLLDMTMPVLSGPETLQQIRASAPAVPVIMMSGYSEHEALGRLGAEGRVAFLPKPFTTQELRERLGDVLGS